MMQRMRQQQATAAELITEAEGSVASVETTASRSGLASLASLESWQCATCREGPSASRPLAMVMDVRPSCSRKFRGGSAEPVAAFNSCRHLLHVDCCERHAA